MCLAKSGGGAKCRYLTSCQANFEICSIFRLSIRLFFYRPSPFWPCLFSWREFLLVHLPPNTPGTKKFSVGKTTTHILNSQIDYRRRRWPTAPPPLLRLPPLLLLVHPYRPPRQKKTSEVRGHGHVRAGGQGRQDKGKVGGELGQAAPSRVFRKGSSDLNELEPSLKIN